MSFTRTLNLYIDIARSGGQNCLLNGESSNVLTVPPTVMQSDIFNLRLHFRQASTGVGVISEAVRLESGSAVVFAGRETPQADDVLFGIAAMPEGGADPYWYEGVLNLNTQELIDALDGKDYIDAACDIEVQNAGNTQRLSYRLPLRVFREVYKDTLPTIPGGGSAELIAGEMYLDRFYLKNQSTGLYHAVQAKDIDGHTTFAIEQTGVSKP